MIDEIATIKLLETRAAYDKYIGGVPMGVLVPEVAHLLKDMGAFYVAFPKSDRIAWPEFVAWYKHTQAPHAGETTRHMVEAVVERVKVCEVTPDMEQALLLGWRRAALVGDVAIVCHNYRQGQLKGEPDEAIGKVLERYARAPSSDTGEALRMKPDAFDAMGDPNAPGYDWGLEDLNQSLGPMRPGYHVLVAGLPEIGKTTFVIDQLLPMLPQADIIDEKTGEVTLGVGLVINNEEDKSRIYTRELSNIFGRSSRDIMANWAKAVEAAQKRNRWTERLLVADCHDWKKEDITALIDAIAPRCVVFHRLDKMAMGKDITGEAQLAAASFWARTIAAKGRAVFSVVQASDSARGKMFPEEKDIFGSKIRLQGDTDAILMIGAEAVDDPRRGLRITRNKLPGGPRSKEEKRYARMEVVLDRVTGRYSSVNYPRGAE